MKVMIAGTPRQVDYDTFYQNFTIPRPELYVTAVQYE
jgi:hypothetical protein